MTRIASLISVGLALSAVTACAPAIHGVDPPEVMARWDLVYSQDCSSWLYSSRTGERYCASPAFRAAPDKVAAAAARPAGAAAAAKPAYDESKTDKASLVAVGEKVYGNTCAVCHQANGEGTAGTFPPLAGAGEYYGDAQNHAKIIVHGLSGEIVVKGVTYNGAMPPQGAMLSDYEIAAVATFERNSWGNNDGVVLPADVKAVR